MKAYKLTNRYGRTYNNTQWGEGVTHEAVGEGDLCCSPGWIHVYDDLLLGVMLNPIHEDFIEPIAWECECSGKTVDDNGLKRGVQRCTTVRQVVIPEVTTNQRVLFAILSALQVTEASTAAQATTREEATNDTVWKTTAAYKAAYKAAQAAQAAASAELSPEAARKAAWAVALAAASAEETLDLPALAWKAMEEGATV